MEDWRENIFKKNFIVTTENFERLEKSPLFYVK